MRQNPPAELQNNVLLPRYPVCFMHGLKSIFHFRDYWHGVPEYLAMHGIQTFEMQAPWRGPHERRCHIFAQQIEKTALVHDKVHLVAHSLGCLDALEIASWSLLKDKIKSITFICPPFAGTPWAQIGLIGKFAGLNLFKSTNETLTEKAAKEIVNSCQIPSEVLVGSIVARPGEYGVSRQLKIQHWALTRFLQYKKCKLENDGLVPLESQRVATKFGPVFLEFPGDHIQVIGAAPWPKNAKTAHEMLLEHCIFLAEQDLKTAKLN